jgi:hypothetical protein
MTGAERADVDRGVVVPAEGACDGGFSSSLGDGP